MPRFADVVPDTKSVLPKDHFTYAVPEQLDEATVRGQRVEIPFGSRTAVGVVVGLKEDSDQADVRAIAAVLDEEPLLQPYQLELARWISARYCSPLGEVIKAMVPSRIRAARPGGRKSKTRTQSKILAAMEDVSADQALPLTPEQQAATAPILEAVESGSHRRFLLHGVTGSGKTEVYMHAIARVVANGKQAIVLVPEIALTPQTMQRFASRFGQRVTVMHSALSEAERGAQWRRIRAGEVDVVVGSRSAVFAPVPKLGLVVADEEDSTSYKQDRIPRYHAIDTAMELARLHDAPVILGSATPRVESFYAAHTGEMELLSLPSRINQRPLPEIELVDLREEFNAGNRDVLSPLLAEAVAQCQADGGQSILFLNRRGTATVVLCRQCGKSVDCQSCSVSLVYHHTRRSCDCHYCGATKPLPQVCESCGSKAIRLLGSGTERLEASMAERFPSLRILRMDRDTTQSRDAYFDIYEKFRAGEADCMIGTQMVAKGWDLGNVRLVGIVNADTALHFPDYRSGEATFSLLTQVAGRAGRGQESARVILQTYSPDHYAIGHALTHDYLGFARQEIRFRKLMKFPPYSRLVTCTISHTNDDKARVEAERVARELAAHLHGLDAAEVPEILGPSAAFVHRLRGLYRWQITLRGRELEPFLEWLPRGRGWSIDVDPAA